jgi:hypothetical protein
MLRCRGIRLGGAGRRRRAQAQQAFAAGKLADLERAARAVPAGHVLAPYVEYWRLMLAGRNRDARVADFLARHPGSFMAESLRADWLKSLGVREAWPAYLAEYPRLQKPDAAHQCYAYRAEWAQGDRSHQREAVALWFTGRDMPSACTPLFEQLMRPACSARKTSGGACGWRWTPAIPVSPGRWPRPCPKRSDRPPRCSTRPAATRNAC